MRKGNGDGRNEISPEAFKVRVAYLQPMSGLASAEDRLTPGSIDRKIGEGKTADVIRNISYQLLHPERVLDARPESEIKDKWMDIYTIIKNKFGIEIQEPTFNPDNGLLNMTYIEKGIEYDLSNAGRGFQQTLLLLCFLYSNPDKVILMDEPDAHLEVLRQKEIYNLISDIARKLNSQLIIASHSEIVLREAASKEDDIVAIIEQSAIKLNDPKLVKDFKKSLTDFGWDKYYLAKLKKHCIYLEGTTDVYNLEAFARKLNHPASGLIEEANIDPVEGNLPAEAFSRFQALKLIEPDLKGLCVFDRLNRKSNPDDPILVLQWNKAELENYFCIPSVLIKWAESKSNTLFSSNYPVLMKDSIAEVTPPISLSDMNDEYWGNEKLSEWTEKVFRRFFEKAQQPVTMQKSNFHELIEFIPKEQVDKEIYEKLDAIYEILKP
ncbi:MAG: AAA family ATPase [Lentimicrobium sp.]